MAEGHPGSAELPGATRRALRRRRSRAGALPREGTLTVLAHGGLGATCELEDCGGGHRVDCDVLQPVHLVRQWVKPW